MARPGRRSQSRVGPALAARVQLRQTAEPLRRRTSAVPRGVPQPYPGDAKCELSVTGLAADLRSKLVQKSATAIVKIHSVSAVELARVSAWLDKRVADMLVLQPLPSYTFWCSTGAAED